MNRWSETFFPLMFFWFVFITITKLIKPNFCILLPQARSTTVFILFYIIFISLYFLFFILLTKLIFYLLWSRNSWNQCNSKEIVSQESTTSLLNIFQNNRLSRSWSIAKDQRLRLKKSSIAIIKTRIHIILTSPNRKSGAQIVI